MQAAGSYAIVTGEARHIASFQARRETRPITSRSARKGRGRRPNAEAKPSRAAERSGASGALRRRMVESKGTTIQRRQRSVSLFFIVRYGIPKPDIVMAEIIFDTPPIS